MTDRKTVRGVTYWRTYADARTIRDAFRTLHPSARIVAYQRGYAVQRERSGPYLVEGTFTPGGYSFR